MLTLSKFSLTVRIMVSKTIDKGSIPLTCEYFGSEINFGSKVRKINL